MEAFFLTSGSVYPHEDELFYEANRELLIPFIQKNGVRECFGSLVICVVIDGLISLSDTKPRKYGIEDVLVGDFTCDGTKLIQSRTQINR